MCRLKAKTAKVVEQCSSLVSRKGEYSKSFSKTKVFKLQVCKVLLKYRFIKHFITSQLLYSAEKFDFSI